MNTSNRTHKVLLLRSWLGEVNGGEAYAYIEAVPARKDPDLSFGRYEDYSLYQRGDDERSTLHLDNFRFRSLIDGTRTSSYAWRWGYETEHSTIFTPDDLRRYAPSIQAVQKGLDRLACMDGPAESLGRSIVRLARILELDGIASLDLSMDSRFRDDTEVSWHVVPAQFGNGMVWINDLEASLHRACARRISKAA